MRSRGTMGCLMQSILGFLIAAAWCASSSSGELVGGGGGGQARLLLGFRETKGNSSFQCSPSGPCVPCQYSEKNDEKYHCSETGYRVPLKCVEVEDGSKVKTGVRNQRRRLSFTDHKFVKGIGKIKWRKLSDDSPKLGNGEQNYIIYRSCVPSSEEEKFSVLGFEVIMVFLLLVSSSVIYLRQKRTYLMPGLGATRISTNSARF